MKEYTNKCKRYFTVFSILFFLDAIVTIVGYYFFGLQELNIIINMIGDVFGFWFGVLSVKVIMYLILYKFYNKMKMKRPTAAFLYFCSILYFLVLINNIFLIFA